MQKIMTKMCIMYIVYNKQQCMLSVVSIASYLLQVVFKWGGN